MATLIERGFGLLNRATGSAAAMRVRYIRGATVISDELPAVLSAPQIELITEGGAQVIGRQFTWRLQRADLVDRDTNERTKPRRSDRIEWGRDGVTYVFEVVRDLGGVESPEVDPRSDWVPANAQLIETITHE